jgi:hypothetical protein
LGQRRGLKNPWARQEDVFLVHPQNDLNGLILNWCIGGCCFTPANIYQHILPWVNQHLHWCHGKSPILWVNSNHQPQKNSNNLSKDFYFINDIFTKMKNYDP